ncbi:hypothetical protein XENTR_v10017681 [Xenopus tropicalis]|nr:hypothetical protein XENTR_v10017681 [Xenopus tropicalis]
MTCLLSISDFPFSRPSGIPLYQWSFPELKPGPIRGYDAVCNTAKILHNRWTATGLPDAVDCRCRCSIYY